ncbi:hypothetical protein [Haloferula sargassicola]|uniref:hypothetical protein n=1 Tax=Haloferula sargassicola TaxID=490096 RepID=UPI0033658795
MICALVAGMLFHDFILVEAAVVNSSIRAGLLSGDEEGEFTEKLIRRAQSSSADVGSAILSECYISASHKIEARSVGFMEFDISKDGLRTAFAGYSNYHHADVGFEAERERAIKLMRALSSNEN